MYKEFILDNLPRVLTQIDRDEHSTTYGCCDRNHWHLKVRDFSSAILQQSGLALAISYQLDFEGNIYYKNENVRRWAIATVEYWAKIQLKDGSFNEYYPWEHGYPPTSFSLYATCETYKRLGMKSDFIMSKIVKTCKYLIKHTEEHAFNQEMAAITAMYSAYQIIKEQWILDGVDEKLKRILSLQSDEGWFPEYGGADLGYLSVCFDMLCEYYTLSGNENVYKSMLKTMDFIQYFIHPDSTVGGEYGSRNTTYFLPNGLQVLAAKGVGVAERAIEVLYGQTRRSDYFMNSTDDRYFSHYLLHSFLRALEKRQNSTAPVTEKLPFEYNHMEQFKESGLISFTNGNYSAIISMKKGGVVKVFNSVSEQFIDCGYRVNNGKGSVSATNWIDKSYRVIFAENQFTVYGEFNKIKLKVPSPILNTGLRVMSFLFGNKLIKFLKRSIIFVDKHDDIKFERSITLLDESIVINDIIESNRDITVERAGNMSLRHVASGKFYMTSDLLTRPEILLEQKKCLKLETQFHVIENKYSCDIIKG